MSEALSPAHPQFASLPEISPEPQISNQNFVKYYRLMPLASGLGSRAAKKAASAVISADNR